LETGASFWTHPSVLGLAQPDDPVGYITQRARQLVFDAVEAGWSGPPFDPFALANHLSLPVIPREDILDARTVPVGADRLQIEFNPNRPPAGFASPSHTKSPTRYSQIASNTSETEPPERT
jgi:hypothetical protein